MRESINIEKSSRNEEECLNLKNEWAGSKIPGVRVSRPKGVATSKAEIKDVDCSKIMQAAIRRGCKRIDYRTEWNNMSAIS